MKGTDSETLEVGSEYVRSDKTERVKGTYLLSNFRLVFDWHVDYSLPTCGRDGGHQVSQEWGTRQDYGMEAVCMLEDVLMFVGS